MGFSVAKRTLVNRAIVILFGDDFALLGRKGHNLLRPKGGRGGQSETCRDNRKEIFGHPCGTNALFDYHYSTLPVTVPVFIASLPSFVKTI